jgi:hypothetical protein
MRMPSLSLPFLRWPRPALGRSPGRGALARLVVGMWLAVHGLVAVAVPVADGMLGHGEQVVAHWEDAQDTSCPPQHDPATCQLCQQVVTSVNDGPADRVAPVSVRRAAGVRPLDLGLGAYEAARRGAPVPRGPPSV